MIGFQTFPDASHRSSKKTCGQDEAPPSILSVTSPSPHETFEHRPTREPRRRGRTGHRSLGFVINNLALGQHHVCG